MPRTKERTPALRDRVLRSAVDVLDADGVAALTTRRVAREAATSTPAVYELFGDKAGLVRALFFEGFRQLHDRLAARAPSTDARADVVAAVETVRAFVVDDPALAAVMFSRPFADFDPGPAERRAGDGVRELLVGRVRRWLDATGSSADPTDLAHVLLALAQGLAAQETAGWLGTTGASRDRRWALAVTAVLDGAVSAPR